MFRKILFISLACFSIFSTVRADSINQVLPWNNENWDEVEEIKNLPKPDFRDEFLPIVARFLIYGMSFLAFLLFFAAGAWLALDGDNEDSVKRAKRAITWGVAGLAFAAASYLLVKGILGIDLSWNNATTINSSYSSGQSSSGGLSAQDVQDIYDQYPGGENAD